MVFSFLAAVQFLTTLPVRLWRDVQGEDVARSLRYFPAVGALLGALLVVLNWLLSFWLNDNRLLIAALLVIAHLLTTGALHFDGFLDSCDGLFGYRTPERRLEIMRDSRVGSFAVAGGWALLTLKLIGLSGMPPGAIPAALLLAPVLGRWGLVLAVVVFPYGRESGLGTLYKQYNTSREIWLALIGVLLFGFIAGGLTGVGLVGLASGATLLIGRWIMTKLPAGLTGDSYGAITEVIETLVWLIYRG
jgi:adenosylcobinamide-GDP ribazoletransferase